MTGDITLFYNYTPCKDDSLVRIADGSTSKVAGKGSVVVSKDITLNSVLYVPKLDCNLLSISKLTRDLNCVTKFLPNVCEFQAMDSGRRIGSAEESAGLYFLRVNNEEQSRGRSYVARSAKEDNNVMLWHYRLGHPNFVYLRQMLPSIFNKSSEIFQCEICQLAKHARNSYPTQPYKSSKPFALVHSDVWGPSRIKTITGARWFVTFIDDHTRTTWVFLMKEKSEVTKIFESFHQMVQTQFQTKVQILRTNNGREYYNTILASYLHKHGMIHQTSCADTPQQNGVAERKNRHLLEVTRSLMMSTNVPNHFWGEAVLSSAYLINRMPSKVLNYK